MTTAAEKALEENLVKHAEGFAKAVEFFRNKWQPPSATTTMNQDEAYYAEARRREFSVELNVLLQRAGYVAAIPAMQALSNAAAAGFANAPLPTFVVNGGKDAVR